MPTVPRIHGWRVVIYPNDHVPAHVHVLGPGWVVVNLIGMQVREAIRAHDLPAFPSEDPPLSPNSCNSA